MMGGLDNSNALNMICWLVLISWDFVITQRTVEFLKGPIKSDERLKRRDERLDVFIETTAWLNICKADFTISPTA